MKRQATESKNKFLTKKYRTQQDAHHNDMLSLCYTRSLTYRLLFQPLAVSFLKRIRSVPAPTFSFLLQSIDSHPLEFASLGMPHSHCNAVILHTNYCSLLTDSKLSSNTITTNTIGMSGNDTENKLTAVIEFKFFVAENSTFLQHSASKGNAGKLCISNYCDPDEEDYRDAVNRVGQECNLVPRWLVEDVAETFRGVCSRYTKEDLEDELKTLFCANSVSLQPVFISGTGAGDGSLRNRLNVFYSFSLLIQYQDVSALLIA